MSDLERALLLNSPPVICLIQILWIRISGNREDPLLRKYELTSLLFIFLSSSTFSMFCFDVSKTLWFMGVAWLMCYCFVPIIWLAIAERNFFAFFRGKYKLFLIFSIVLFFAMAGGQYLRIVTTTSCGPKSPFF